MSDRGAPRDESARRHQDAARGHEEEAGWWDERGEAEWAEFERRAAGLELEAALLEADLGELERLRAGWLEQRGEAGRAEIERGSAEIERRGRAGRGCCGSGAGARHGTGGACGGGRRA